MFNGITVFKILESYNNLKGFDTVDKNNINAPKMKNIFWCSIKLLIFLYCSHNVFALPTLR